MLKQVKIFTSKIFIALLLSATLLSFQSCDGCEENPNESKSKATQCLGITLQGVRCKNKTTNANGYCHLHQDQAK